ncbi:hypothetical protein ACRYCC_19795 [Actinomadura scrupuli]
MIRKPIRASGSVAFPVPHPASSRCPVLLGLAGMVDDGGGVVIAND